MLIWHKLTGCLALLNWLAALKYTTPDDVGLSRPDGTSHIYRAINRNEQIDYLYKSNLTNWQNVTARELYSAIHLGDETFIFLSWSVVQYPGLVWFGLEHHAIPNKRERTLSSSSEKFREGPHDEPGVDVSLQEFYVGCSANHGVQVPSMGRLVEINITPHEYTSFRRRCTHLIQAIIQHFCEDLTFPWIISRRSWAELDSCWMIWYIPILWWR